VWFNSVLILAATIALFGCSVTERTRVVRATSWPEPLEQPPEQPLAVGQTIYLLSTGACRGLVDDPRATIDTSGDVCFTPGHRFHVAGLSETEADTVLQKFYVRKYYKHWDFVVSQTNELLPKSSLTNRLAAPEPTENLHR
jgi:hypothetical protein